MQSYFNISHWNHVKKVRAERGLNRIQAESLLRPNHRLMGSTLRQRASGELWQVTAIREEWHLGRYLTATLEHAGVARVCVIELISCEEPEIIGQLARFNEEFDVALD